MSSGNDLQEMEVGTTQSKTAVNAWVLPPTHLKPVQLLLRPLDSAHLTRIWVDQLQKTNQMTAAMR